MQVGDIVRVKARVLDETSQKVKSVMRKAQVIYIHPKHRFYTVQFESGVRESFDFERRVGEDRPTKHGFHAGPRDGNRSRKY